MPRVIGRMLSLRDDPTIMRLIRIYFSENVAAACAPTTSEIKLGLDTSLNF